MRLIGERWALRLRRGGALAATVALVLGGSLSPAAAETIVRTTAVAQSGWAMYAPLGSSSYALAKHRLADGRTVVLRWNPCQVITYTVNVAAVPAAGRAAVAAEVRAAVSRLAAVTNIRFSYRGSTTSVPRTTNVTRQGAELVVAVAAPSATDFKIGNGVLGYGGYRYWQWTTTSSTGRRTSGAAIARGWVVIDVNGLMRLSPGFAAGNTRGNVMLHELAHVVGLNHVTDARQLLYPTLTAAAPNGYAAGDTAGLGKVGRSAGCITVPSGVVADLG